MHESPTVSGGSACSFVTAELAARIGVLPSVAWSSTRTSRPSTVSAWITTWCPMRQPGPMLAPGPTTQPSPSVALGSIVAVRSTVAMKSGCTDGPVVSLSRRRNVPLVSSAGFADAAMPTQYVVPPGRLFQ